MVQEWIAGGLVALALAYVVWRWMPAAWRQRLGRVHPRLAQSPECGACSSCGGCAGGPAAAQETVVQMPTPGTGRKERLGG